MTKQKERELEEEERRRKERERLIAMEREREEFRIKRMEKEMEKERERQRIMDMELEREREKAKQERLAQIPAQIPAPISEVDRHAHQKEPAWSAQAGLARTENTASRMPDMADDHLPTSPAPPPYKSPSPDSEHARLSHKAKTPPHPPPPGQFAFHPSVLGVMPDYGTTDFGGNNPTEVGGSRLGRRVNLRSRRFHSRSPRLRSPQPDEAEVGTRESLSPVPDLVNSLQSGQSVSNNFKEPDTVVTNSSSQFQPRSRSDAARYLKPHSNFTDGFVKEEDRKVVSRNEPPSLHDPTPEKSKSQDNSSNMFEELDELLGGVTAMITEVKLTESTPISVPSRGRREEREDDDDEEEGVIQPPAAFKGEESTMGWNELGSVPGNQHGSAPGSQLGSAHGNQLTNGLPHFNEDGGSMSSEESEEWMEGSPVVEQRRIAMATSMAKQDKFAKPPGLVSAPGGDADMTDHMTQEREWQNGGWRNEEEEREESDSGSVVIRPPSPYAGGSGRGAGLEENGLLPPPIPPLPAAHLLDELEDKKEEEFDASLGGTPPCPDEDMDQIDVRPCYKAPYCMTHTYTQSICTHVQCFQLKEWIF